MFDPQWFPDYQGHEPGSPKELIQELVIIWQRGATRPDGLPTRELFLTFIGQWTHDDVKDVLDRLPNLRPTFQVSIVLTQPNDEVDAWVVLTFSGDWPSVDIQAVTREFERKAT